MTVTVNQIVMVILMMMVRVVMIVKVKVMMVLMDIKIMVIIDNGCLSSVKNCFKNKQIVLENFSLPESAR